MEKEKLNDACDTAFLEDYFPSATESPDPRWELFADGFKQGAEWLMGQPLSERLTEEERENYRCIYSIAERMIDEVKFVNPQLFDVFNGQLMLLKSIFGKEMFENKE